MYPQSLVSINILCWWTRKDTILAPVQIWSDIWLFSIHQTPPPSIISADHTKQNESCQNLLNSYHLGEVVSWCISDLWFSKDESQFSWALNTSSEGPKTQVATWNKQYSIILQIVETWNHSQNLSFGLHVSVAGHETWVQLASLTSSAKPLPATWQIINSFVLIVNDNKS